MWKCEKRYLLGVPFSEAEARAFKQAIDDRNGVIAENPKDQPAEKRFAAAFIIDGTNALITSKAVGLLQADSILAAVATLVAGQQTDAQQSDVKFLATICVAVALLSCGVRLPILTVRRAKDARAYIDPTRNFFTSMCAAQWRAAWFFAGLTLSVVAFVIAVVTMGLVLWEG